MDAELQERQKHREIRFLPGGPQDPAPFAKILLEEIDGIIQVDCVTPHCLSICYDIQNISLRSIEEALSEVGFLLDQGLLVAWRRALIYYTEATQQLNLGQQHSKSTTEIFINRYNQLKHGCRDDRPEYYHHYN